VIPAVIPHCYFRTDEELRTYKRAVQQDLDRSDVVFTVSDCSKQDLLKHFRLRSEPVIIYNANCLPLGSPADVLYPQRLEAGRYFINVGGYERRKGLDILIRVYAQLYRQGAISIPLVLTGQPAYIDDAFRRDIESAKASGAVIELGYLNDNDLAVVLRNARGLICPSLYEGFGFPPLEAMASGCPVITSNVSSLPEICGDAAIYVRPGDENTLGSAIIALNNNDHLRMKLSDAGLRQAANFSWDKSADLFFETLETLISGVGRILRQQTSSGD
jgi:alpha-1,3-rhamnosyl/mannosyltransferase